MHKIVFVYFIHLLSIVIEEKKLFCGFEKAFDTVKQRRFMV